MRHAVSLALVAQTPTGPIMRAGIFIAEGSKEEAIGSASMKVFEELPGWSIVAVAIQENIDGEVAAKRGRKPKLALVENDPSVKDHPSDTAAEAEAPKKRGRKPKEATPPEAQTEEAPNVLS